MRRYDIIIVGAGAAGLMAACEAGRAGLTTVVLEKMPRPARKLRITGKGRCNITNTAPRDEFIAHFGKNGRFLHQAFARFFSDDLIAFFRENGIECVTERGGRVFPADGDATGIVDSLVRCVRRLGVIIETGRTVTSLIIRDGTIGGVEAVPSAKRHHEAKRNSAQETLVYEAPAVIIATGGASYPDTGSTGDGYRLAATAGHTIIPPRPALVPIETAGTRASRLDGLTLRNVSVTLLIDGKKAAIKRGDVLITSFGLSGPVVLSLSGRIVDSLQAGRTVSLSLDLKPALDDEKLDKRLLRDFDAHGKRQFRTLLTELLPRQLIDTCIEETAIPAETPGHQITTAMRGRVRQWLKNVPFTVTGYRGFDEAIITAGGVDTREINPRTMESRLVRGLFFAGEVINIAADTGGYNLQAAFSTGRLAGKGTTDAVHPTAMPVQ